MLYLTETQETGHHEVMGPVIGKSVWDFAPRETVQR